MESNEPTNSYLIFELFKDKQTMIDGIPFRNFSLIIVANI